MQLGSVRDAMEKHPVMSILLIGVIVRSVLSVLFTYTYDISYWALILENIQSDSGLYGMQGYYYTPVWGYFIAVIGMFMDFVLGVDVLGMQADPFVWINGVSWEYYEDMLTTIEFNLVFKAALNLIDIAISYMLYRMVLEFTGDRRKAAFAFAMWFLCPIVVYTSCVQAMFDNLSVLVMIMTVYLLMKGNYIFAGMAFSMCVLTKYFPAYLIFLLVAYIVSRHRGDARATAVGIGSSILGAVIMLAIIYAPNIIDGTIVESLGFILNRVGTAGSDVEDTSGIVQSLGYTVVLVLQPLIFALEIYLAYKMATFRATAEETNVRFLFYAMLSAACIFLWTPTPTYLLVIIPFLIMHILVSDRRYLVSYILLATIPMLFSLGMHNFSILFHAGFYLNLFSDSAIMGGIMWMDSASVLGMTNLDLVNLVLGALVTVSIYSIFMVMYRNHHEDKSGGAPDGTA